MRLLELVATVALGATLHLGAQTIGTVAVEDATVSGDLSVSNGRAVLVGSSTVVARDHTAEIALNRGGTVRVCATSGLHMTQSHTAGAQPLMLALDRGAIEIETAALTTDIVMTPDLRFSFKNAGPLDLRMRVTPNGDTCVENRGETAPTLGVLDQFGEGSYQLLPGQHVLFEHGSLKEVVDHESSPCGCPTTVPGMSIADAALSEGKTPAAEQHPFPAAVSQGLATPQPIPQAPAGVAHAQVAATLGYSSNGTGTIAGTPASNAGTPNNTLNSAQDMARAQPAAPTHSRGFAHRIGRFFKRLFGG